MIKTLLYIALGGAIGSIFRYFLSIIINKYWAHNFPLATFVTNVLGCFLIGLFFGILEKYYLPSSTLKYLLITGFCGGFTTFSAFAFENFTLFQNQNTLIAVIYIGTSIFIGIIAVWLGLILSR